MSAFWRHQRHRQYTRGNTPELDSFKTMSIEDIITAVRASPSGQSFAQQTVCLRPSTDLAPEGCHYHPRTLHHNNFQHFSRTWRHAIVTPLLKKAGLDESSPQAIVRFQIFLSFWKSSKGLSTVNSLDTSTSFTCFQMLSQHTDDVTQQKLQY